jgi:hypothetical protein
MTVRGLLSRFSGRDARDTRDIKANSGFEVSRPLEPEVGTVGTPGTNAEACPECPDLVPTQVGTLKPAETLAVPSVPTCPDQIADELRDDPAEWRNWAPLEDDPNRDLTAREDVRLVVEDLADEGMRPRRIARKFGLTADEVLTILRRSGR